MRNSFLLAVVISFLCGLISLPVSTAKAAQGGLPNTGGSDEIVLLTAPDLPDPLTQQAIRDVLSKLNDAQVRNLLLQELDKQVAEQEKKLAGEEQLSAGDILFDWAGSFSQSLVYTINVAPKILGAAKTTFANFKAQRIGRSLWYIPGSLLACLLLGVTTVLVTSRLMKGVRKQLDALQPSNLWIQMGIVSARFAVQGVHLCAFILAAFLGNSILNNTAPVDSLVIRYVLGMVCWSWFAIMLARFVLSPSRPDLRLCAVGDGEARFLTRRIGMIFCWSAFTGLSWLQQFDWPFGEVRLGFWLTTVFYCLVISTLWQGRKGITQMVIGSEEMGSGWYRFAEMWPAIAIVLVLFQWLIVEMIVATGNIQKLSMTAMNITLAIVIALPLFELMVRALVRASWPGDPTQGQQLKRIHKETQAGLIHCGRVFLVAGAVVVLGMLWGLDLRDVSSQTAGLQLAGAMMEIIVIAVIAYGLWELLNVIADRQVSIEQVIVGGEADSDDQSDGEGGGGSTRLGTLMPLARGAGHAVIAVTTVLLILDRLAINVTPLLAGAGIFGLAVGFGAQTLVKDIFSGVFFLIDDAFRKGEYIGIGAVKGCVEKISIRSMQLRHHTGQLNTVPFGDIQQLTNFSRDWVTMKLSLRLTYGTDTNKVRKMIKNLGKELLNHPEIGHLFVNQLKSQGVMSMEDSAMIMRIKFTTKPGDQFTIRRFVLDSIRKLFEANGIKFASREVTVRIADHDAEQPVTMAEKNAMAAAARSIVEQEEK